MTNIDIDAIVVEQLDGLDPFSRISSESFAEVLVLEGRRALTSVLDQEPEQQNAVVQAAVAARLQAIIGRARGITAKRGNYGEQPLLDAVTNKPLPRGGHRKPRHHSQTEQREWGE